MTTKLKPWMEDVLKEMENLEFEEEPTNVILFSDAELALLSATDEEIEAAIDAIIA